MKFHAKCYAAETWDVAPLAGAWIEILGRQYNDCGEPVAPLAGAWIEIKSPWQGLQRDAWSLPSRERGLKSQMDDFTKGYFLVAPLAGAWIEIDLNYYLDLQYKSLPSRERGLKSFIGTVSVPVDQVAPLAGAWIEMERSTPAPNCVLRRSPRGSVD